MKIDLLIHKPLSTVEVSEEMIKKSAKYVTVFVILVFFGVNIGSSCIQNTDTIATPITDKIGKIYEFLYHGEAKRGIIAIESSDAEGIPDDMYNGVISKLNITLYGEQMFSLVPLPWFILSTYFENTGTMFVKMDFFWGYINPIGETIFISGFAKNIQWDWE